MNRPLANSVFHALSSMMVEQAQGEVYRGFTIRPCALMEGWEAWKSWDGGEDKLVAATHTGILNAIDAFYATAGGKEELPDISADTTDDCFGGDEYLWPLPPVEEDE